MNIKPVIISSRGAGVFVDHDGRMEVVADKKSIQIQDTRAFIQQAEGNHHALVFGDHLEDLKVMSNLLDTRFLAV